MENTRFSDFTIIINGGTYIVCKSPNTRRLEKLVSMRSPIGPWKQKPWNKRLTKNEHVLDSPWHTCHLLSAHQENPIE